MAQGMNAGIFSLLAVITVVLSTCAAFFVFLARRSANAAGQPGPGRTSVPARPDLAGLPEKLGLARTLALPESPTRFWIQPTRPYDV